ncbi:hypothetical protein [Sporichthya polymorpha]|uniref:hypothetical protein n=1 Tax=Sporichthya polymorpha TaxID=35751 RepID=UPI00037A0474|nr:hypothetical protein [Sporichthya polymorpha]
MFRIGTTAIAAALLVAGSIAPAEASSANATASWKAGPANGDASTFHQVDAGTGEITIFQHNTRQAGTVHCVGEGPRATLVGEQVTNSPASMVRVDYVDAIMTEHPIIDVIVMGSNGRVLGHKAAFGPKYYESGSVEVPLFKKSKAGETVRVLTGLQVHAGCLPHPFVLGLAGSRPLEGARVTFPSFSVS